jgi:hypothetical protein
MTTPRPQRQRVVLSHRRGTRMMRTRVELQQQTGVGDALVRGLVRAQLGLALRLMALVVGGVVALALSDSLFPALSEVSPFGVRPNWLILGLLIYPVLYGLGRLYIRLAEQGERDFVRIVDAGEER